MTQDDAGSAPMLGSQEPSWWEVSATLPGVGHVVAVRKKREDAISDVRDAGGSEIAIAALFRSPALTDTEREAIEVSREFWQLEADCSLGDETDRRYADALRGLLERLT